MTNYQKIMTSNEADGIRSVTEKWMMLSENLKKRGNSLSHLPDLFWRVTPGIGTSTLLHLFAAFLEECDNLLEHHGELTVLEKRVHYCYSQDSALLRRDLTEAMENATGHTDRFTGILALHLGEWLGHTDESAFLELLEQLKGHDRRMLIVFILPTDQTENVEEMQRTLSLFFRLEEVVLRIPETKRLLDFVCEKLTEEGITLEEDARALLEKTVTKLRCARTFKGYYTLTMLAEDIAYEALSMENFPESGRLSATMLSGFSASSAYIKRLEKRERTAPRIGFQ